MNTELLYTIGVGNIRSFVSIYALESLVFLMAIDMDHPAKGVFLAFIIATVISLIGIGAITYYNSEGAISADSSRYVRTIDDKLKVFRRILLIAYLSSLLILLLMYFAGVGVASYFFMSVIASVFVFIAVLSVHDYATNMRYNQLKRSDWVFDYNRVPVVRTVSKGMNVGITMFNEENQFIINDTAQPIEIDDIFSQLPPGTKLAGYRIKKPEFKEIRFNAEFHYNNMRVFKSINLKKESKHDIKMINLYMNEISKYASLYLIEDGFINCLKATLSINHEKIDKYIEDNDYVKRFVPSKEAEVAYISMMLKPDFSKMSYKKFMARHTKIVDRYTLKQMGTGLYLNDGSVADKEEDISYLQQYMSLNIDEYKCRPKDNSDEAENFTSLQDKIENFPRRRKKEEKQFGKTLHRLDLGGNHIYFFAEDLKSLSELDEIVFSKFINRDLQEVTEKHGLEE